MSRGKQVKQTEIAVLPEEWKLVRLERVIQEIKNGFASGKRDDNGIVQIRMNNVTTDGRLVFNSFLKVPVPENINDFLLKENDFLFNNTNSIDLVGKSTIFKQSPFPCTFSNHFTRIRFTKEVLPEWILFHFITLWEKGFFKSVAIRHVGQSAVHTKYLTNLKLPLPPLSEQKKIAEILSTVDKAVEKVEEDIDKTKRLKKGLMQELLTGRWNTVDGRHGKRDFKQTEIGRIPKEWEVVTIADVADVKGGKRLPKGHSLVDFKTPYPYIRVVDFKNMGVDISNLQYLLPQTHKLINQYVISSNDVYISIAGSVGMAGRTPLELNGANLTENAAKLCNLTKVTKEFLAYFLNSALGQRQIFSFVGKAQQPKLALFRIEKIKTPLPPFAEQKKIAEILGTVDKRSELLRKKKEKLERVRKGLMNDLLTGRKRVKISRQ